MRQPKSFEEAEHLARLKVAVKESIDMKDQLQPTIRSDHPHVRRESRVFIC